MSNKYKYYTNLLEKGLIDDNKFYSLATKEYSRPNNGFTLDQVDDLEKRSKDYDIDFERNIEDDEVKIVSVMNQLASGVVEGFTTLGWADDPANSTEAMVNKIGHLLGFAPDIIMGVLTVGTSLPGSVAKKSAFRAARIAAAEKVQKGLGDIAKKPFMLSKTDKAGNITLRSVPMRAADWVIDNGKKALGGEEFMRNNFIGKKLAANPDFKDLLEESAHLGLAMAVSAREEGAEGMVDAAKHGAMAGAFFGSVRNYVNVGQKLASANKAQVVEGKSILRGKAKDLVRTISKKGGVDKDKAEYIDFYVRGTAGSAFTGLQSTYQGAPTEDQAYEYLLGFFFGASGRPAHEARGTKAIMEHMNGKIGDKKTLFNVDTIHELANSEYAKTEWYKNLKETDAKAAEYVDAFMADHIASRIDSMGGNTSDAMFEFIREAINDMGVKGEDVLSKRDKIAIFMKASDIAIKDISTKNKKLLEAARKDVEQRPDTDISKIKVGDEIIVYNELASQVMVEVKNINAEGKIEVFDKVSNKKEILEEGSFTSRNVYSPNYVIPAYKFIPENFHNKKISELTNSERTELNKALNAAMIKTTNKQTPIKDTQFILDNSNRILKSLEHKDITDKLETFNESEKTSKDMLENPDKLEVTEREVGGEVDKDQSLKRDVDTEVSEIIINLKKDYPTLNVIETRQGLKKIAQQSKNINEFKTAAQDYIVGKEKVAGDKQAFTDAELNKLYFDYSAMSERGSLTAMKDEKGNWTLIDTPRTDGNNNGLLVSREESYHNSLYDTPIDRKIQYFLLSDKPDNYIKSSRDELGRFTSNQKNNWEAINGQLVAEKTNEYVSHINNSGSSNALNVRKLAFSKNELDINYLPPEIRKELFNWASNQKEISQLIRFYDKNKTFQKDLSYRGKNKQEKIERYTEEFLSNVIYELQDAGMLNRNADGSMTNISVSDIQRGFKKYENNPLYKNIIKWSSYRKSFETGRPLEGDYSSFIRTGENGIRTMIINDANGVFGISDGQKYYSKELREVILKELGRLKEEGYIKDVLLKEAEFSKDRGMVVNKSAEQATHEGIYELMKRLNVDILLVDSAVKSNSRHKQAEIVYDAKSDSYKVKKAGEIFQVKPEEIRITKTEAEVKDKVFQRIPWGQAMIRQSSFGKKFNDAMTELFQAAPRGDIEYMKAYKAAKDKGFIDPTAELLVNGKPIEIDKLDTNEIIDILNEGQGNVPVWSAIVKSIFKDKTSNIEPYERVGKEELDKEMRSVQDLLETMNYDPIVAMVGNNAKFIETTLRNYLATRFSRPKVEYGMSYLRFKAADPMLLSKINLTNDNFYLHAGDKSKSIQLNNGESKPLGEVFDMYKQAKKDGNKTLELDLEDAMSMVIVRSPVGNPSGILSLKFGGFADIAGRGIIVSKENANRGGGLDFDGDAAAIYQSLPSIVKKTFMKPEVKDMLKDFDLTQERRELGFAKEPIRKNASVLDIFSPMYRRNQSLEMIKVSKMIGQVTNLNQMIREHLNYIIQSPDKIHALDIDGNLMLTAKKSIRIKGKDVKMTPEQLLQFFESMDAPNILNLTLDGSKNSSNPDASWLKNVLFTKYFNVSGKTNSMDALIPTKLMAGYNQKTMSTFQGPELFVYDYGKLTNGLPDKYYINTKNNSMGKKAMDALLESDLMVGKEVRVLDEVEYKKYERLASKYLEPESSYEFNRKSLELGIKYNSGKNGMRNYIYEGMNKEGQLQFRMHEDTNKSAMIKLDQDTVAGLAPVGLHPSSGLKARQEWLTAIKGGRDENGRKTNVGTMSDIAERYLENYIINDMQSQKDGVVAYYQDSLIDIARIYTEKDGIHKYDVNLKSLNEADYPNLHINLLKALHKVHKSPTMSYMIKKGIISEDLLSFVQTIDSKVLKSIEKGESNNKIQEIFNVYGETLKQKNAKGKIFDPGRLPEQYFKVASLLNLEVRMTQARDVLGQIGKNGRQLSKTQIDNKIQEIIDVAYEIKLSDFISQQSAAGGLNQGFDLNHHINNYVKKRLKEFGTDREGYVEKNFNKGVMSEATRLTLKNPVAIKVLEDIFYTSLLSNVTSGERQYRSYFSEMERSMTGNVKKSDNFLKRYDIDLETIQKDSRGSDNLKIAIASATQHYFERKNIIKKAVSEGQDPATVIIEKGFAKTLPDHIGRINQFRPNFLKLESIPTENKINFLRGVKEILDVGQTINSQKIAIKVNIPINADRGQLPARRYNSQKVNPKTKVIEFTKEGEKIISKEIGKVESMKAEEKLEELIYATNKEEVDFIKNLLEHTDVSDIDALVSERITSKFDAMSKIEKMEFLEKQLDRDVPLDMYDLRNSVIKKETVITDNIAKEIELITDIVRQNPQLGTNLEGEFTRFTAEYGLTGAPTLGKAPKLMNLPDIRAFRRMLQDVYVSKKGMGEKLKEYARKLGKNVFDLDFNKPPAKDLNPILKSYHYYFQGMTGVAGKMRMKEMLTQVKNDVPVIDKVDGEYIVTKRSMTVPTSTLELVRQQVDFGNTLASTFQDYFEDIIKDSFSILNVEDVKLQKELNTLVEAAVNKRLYDGGLFGGRIDSNGAVKTHYDRATQKQFTESWDYSKKQIKRMSKEHGMFNILNETSSKGKTKEATPEQVVDIINERITSFYKTFMENVITVGMKEISPGRWVLRDSVQNKVMTNGFIDMNKVNRRFKELQLSKKTKVNLMDNLIGMNELLFYKHEYQIVRTLKNMKDPLTGELLYPNFNPADRKTFTKELAKEANELRKATQQTTVKVVTRDGVPSNYWTFTNHSQFKSNQKNIDNWLSNKMADLTAKITKLNQEQLPPEYKVLVKSEVMTLAEAKQKILSAEKDNLMITLQRYKSMDAGMSESMNAFIGNKRGRDAIGNVGIAGMFRSKGQTPIPGFGKDLNVLTRYVKSTSKSYIDTLVGLRGSNLIDTFEANNYMKNSEHTGRWAGYMRDALNNMLGLNTSRSLELHGVTKAEKNILDIYVQSDLDSRKLVEKLGRPLKYKEEYFIQQVNEHIAPDTYWYRKIGDNLSGEKLRNEIQKHKMREAVELNKIENIDKINKSNTMYNMVTDHSATNFIRTQEERIGSFLGYKKGEFSIFGDLRMSKDPVTGEMVKVSEEAKRIAIARKIKAFSDFEGKWELLSLLSHPKTAVTNFIGGTTNIYADTGWKPFRDATNTEYLINNVFNGARYEVKNPRTGEIRLEKFKSMKDIETWLSQEGFLEGMYIEETGINRTFKDANMQKAAQGIIRRLFSKKNQKMLRENPTEYEKERLATIREIAEKNGIEDAVVKFGSIFMSKSEIALRRTAALAHYLNARQVLQPLMKELSYNSPMLMHIAKKGIESSQFIYHSAYRTNYSNTSLGRVMTRFHPYAWNSIKRRRAIFKGAEYTEWSNYTNSSKIAQRQLTADLMSMSLASVFTSTIFEYALSPPMSWLQDTAQWLFGDEETRKRAFFSQWPSVGPLGPALAPLQVVTPPIARYVLPPINAIASGDFDTFVQFQLATFAPFGRLLRDSYRTIKNPSMAVDWMTGLPIHRIGSETKNRRAVREEKRLQEEIEDNEQ